MDISHSTPDPPSSSRSTSNSDRVLIAALVAVSAPAALAYGAVHFWIRGSIGVCAAMLALALLLRQRDRSAPPTLLVGLWFVALCAVAWSFVAFVPAGHSLRGALQPGYSGLLSQVAAVAEFDVRPLALHPRGALFATAYAIHMLLVAAAVAVTVTSPRRAMRVGAILVGTALLVLLLHFLQVVSGATSIGWISGIGEGRPFFGSFANPNHGGVLCGALAPLAAAIGLANRRYLVFMVLAAFLLTSGAFLSGSRGATAVCGLGFLIFFLVDGRPLLVKTAWAGVASVLAAAAFLGPDSIFEVFSQLVDPSMIQGAHPLSDRPQLWRDASALAGRAPLVGVGGDGFLDAYRNVKISPRFALASQAHNDPYQLLVEHGLPSLMLWLSCALFVVGSGVRACRSAEPRVRTLLAGYIAVVCGLLGFALFDFPMRIGALLMVGAIAVGSTLGLSYRLHASADRRLRSVASATVVLAALAGFGLLGVALTARTSAFGEDQVALDAGAAALGKGELEQAEAHFATALRQRPLNHMALLQLAQVARQRGRDARAVDLLRLASEVYPTYPFTWLSLARVERSLGNREAALDAYRRLIELNHPSEEPKPWLDEAFAYAGDFEHIFGFLLFDRSDRYCPAAHWLERSGDRRGAELLYRLGSERNAQCATEYGWRIFAWGHPEEALAWIAPLHRNCITERTRSHALLALGRNEEGLAAAEGALKYCGSADRLARICLAGARLRVGDMRAMGMLERLLSDKDEAVVRHLLFRGYVQAGRSDKAAEQAVILSKQGEATAQELDWLRRFAAGAR